MSSGNPSEKSPPAGVAAAAKATPAQPRKFGRLQLLRLLGRSERTMAWRANDPRSNQELMLVLPRQQPQDAGALQVWRQVAQQAARLNHPQLAPVVDLGVHEGWPFVAHALNDQATLLDRLTAKGLPSTEAAALVCQVLRGLAFAHESGSAHHDVQAFLMLVTESGQLTVAGAAVAAELAVRSGQGLGGGVGKAGAMVAAESGPPGSAGADPGGLRWQRHAAQRDVLAAGVLMHGLLAGEAALGEVDINKVIQRLPPEGNDVVRLPWSVSYPVGEPLRAIVNRATDRQDTRRYLSARTLLRALEGWQQSDAEAGGGPLALLLDRLAANGAMPSSPGAAARAAKLAMMDRSRTNELAEVVLDDLALSFELLRTVNSAQVRGAQLGSGGPVLTVRRAIAMVGLEGVRRCALALRDWPGPLQANGAAELERLIARCKRAGRLALALRPAGYDGEVIYLVTLLQNLGRLVLHYHFPDEAVQMRRLMQPVAATRQGEREEPGMAEDAAAYAVLGADPMALGLAVARHWGLDDSVLAIVRPLALATPVREPDNDDELLRTVASCANEAVDALEQPTARIPAALQRVVQRYGRLLNFGVRELQTALQDKSPLALHSQPANQPTEAAGEEGVQAQMQAQLPQQTPSKSSPQTQAGTIGEQAIG